MADDLARIFELRLQGLYCSQILIQLGLDLQGKDNPDLLCATQALAGGLGFTGHLCGALSGGACLLGLYAGKVGTSLQDDEKLTLMVMELVDWFESDYGSLYGGINCDQILGNKSQSMTERCPDIVFRVHQKVKSILIENGFSLDGNNNESR